MIINSIVFLITFNSLLFSSNINILYDLTSDGKVDPSSIWIVKMIKEAGKINGIYVNFESSTWSRALELVKDGIADGVINASYKKERAKYAVYPFINGHLDTKKSLKSPAYYLYKRKDNPLEFDGKELINYEGIISAIKSYAVVDNLKLLNANIRFGINSTSNLNNVLFKKYTATAELESEADHLINSNEIMKKNIVKLPIPIRKKEYYLIFSKKFYKENQNIAEKIWNEIEKLKNTKKYKEMRMNIPNE